MEEVLLVGVDFVAPDGLYVLNGNGQGVASHVIGRTCFKLIGEFFLGGVLESDALNHFAAALIGRHLLK